MSTALLGTCCAAAFARAPLLILAACVQAIQARQVLRGTVAELVKETRRQESEGEASGVTIITISSLYAQLAWELTLSRGHGTCFVISSSKHAVQDDTAAAYLWFAVLATCGLRR